jgi:hypothetical protein
LRETLIENKNQTGLFQISPLDGVFLPQSYLPKSSIVLRMYTLAERAGPPFLSATSQDTWAWIQQIEKGRWL